VFRWKLAFCEDSRCRDLSLRTPEDIRKAGLEAIDAEVPGNLECDMMRAGLLPDLYYSDNALLARKLENLHVWYFTEFEADGDSEFIRFEGVDTFAEVYVNGALAASSSNMFVPFDVSPAPGRGMNSMVVHIRPAAIEARRVKLPPARTAMPYTYPTLAVRKAAHMFGWDIMPRIVSAGIWRPVTLQRKKTDRIDSVYFAVTRLSDGRADMNFHISATLGGDLVTDYSVRVRGSCGDSSFSFGGTLWHTDARFGFSVDRPRLWWPKNSGEPCLYDTAVELCRGGRLCDSLRLDLGIRTVELERRDPDGAGDPGEFLFRVNGKKIFVMGTNWVPLDAFHGRDAQRLDRALELLDGTGCNMVRCWGGNVYESDAFFDFCDRKGIMVWQDFAMGCGRYPDDAPAAAALADEAVCQILRLRNHASLALWAGDNECDCAAAGWNGIRFDPNDNRLTRDVLRRAVADWDYGRPYLPSSPFISEKVFSEGLAMPEDHLWGPRDYFKGDYYRNATCSFASETGYHGFPAVESLRSFLREPGKLFEPGGETTREYLVHAACPDPREGAAFAYRIRLARSQVETLFGSAEEDLGDFVRQSQISQAEAKKYFIERFRIGKWRRTGIIWWNLLDGWPQVSDAVVDYYFRKKLAYSFIKRSQEPLCLMIDEPEGGVYGLFAANERPYGAEFGFAVRDVATGEVLLSGRAEAPAESSARIGSLELPGTEPRFLLIEWDVAGLRSVNHHVTNIRGCSFRWYAEMLERSGLSGRDALT
jgi:beta-mannosidase